jgi:hypothetical protein
MGYPGKILRTMGLRVKYCGIRGYVLVRGTEQEPGAGTALDCTQLDLFYQFWGGWLGGETIHILAFRRRGLGAGNYLLLDKRQFVFWGRNTVYTY